MSVSDELIALRRALPGKIGVRAISTAMGFPDTPNAYGYYESHAFNREFLPIEKARLIARAFESFGGDPRAIMRLAGVEAGEAEDPPKALNLLPMAVALPSEADLTNMLQGLLEGVGLRNEAAAHAGTLARRLPAALARAVARQAPAGFAPWTSAGEPAQPPARPDLD